MRTEASPNSRRRVASASTATCEIVLVIHWQGGRHTEVRVAKSANGRTQRYTDAEAIELVRRMAGRWSDHMIATQLNRLGWCTGTGKNWTDARVRELRSRLKLPVADPSHQMLTAKEAAQRLGLSAQYVGLLLSKGVVPGTQIAPGTPWWIEERVLDSEEVQAALRALRNRQPLNRGRANLNLRIPGL